MALEPESKRTLHFLVHDLGLQDGTNADEDYLTPERLREVSDFLLQRQIGTSNYEIKVTTIRTQRVEGRGSHAPPYIDEEQAEDILRSRPDPESARRRLGSHLLREHDLTCRYDDHSDSKFEHIGSNACPSDPWAWNRAAFYAPLTIPSAPLHIRLLSLYWSEKHGPVMCSMDTVELDSAPPFAALSYSWGKEAGMPHWIYCNGQRIPVRSNLFRALDFLSEPPMMILRQADRHLQKSDFHGLETGLEPETSYRIRRLWVDALCIDQENQAEKTEQVQQMGRIYSKAERVISWVSPNVEFNMNGLEIFVWGKHAFLGVFDESVHLEEECETVHGVPSHDHPGWREVLALFRNEYFERSWVVQEVALAKKAVLVIRRMEIDWHLVGGVAGVFDELKIWQFKDKHNPYRLPLMKNPFENAKKLHSLCIDRKKTHEMLDLLVQLREWKCGDPIDKVYSLFGITNSPVRTARYGVNKYDLFRQTARALILQRQNLDVLSHVPQTQLHWGPYEDLSTAELMVDQFLESNIMIRLMSAASPPDPSLIFTERKTFTDGVPPSWAPAWDFCDLGPQNAPLLVEEYGYAASSSEPPNISALGDAALLSAGGLHFDTIEVCSDVIGNLADFYITKTDPVHAVECFSSVFGSSYPDKDSVETFDRRWDFALAIVAGFPTADLSKSLDVSAKNMVRSYWEATLGAPFLDPYERSEIEDEAPALDITTRTDAEPSVTPTDFVQWRFIKGNIKCTHIGNHHLARLPGDISHPEDECVGCRVGSSYCARLCKIAYHRRVFYTKSGHFGLGPANMKSGDEVVALFGGKVLYVLRRKADHYQLIGDCYVHKAMHGEVLEAWREGQINAEVFEIL